MNRNLLIVIPIILLFARCQRAVQRGLGVLSERRPGLVVIVLLVLLLAGKRL